MQERKNKFKYFTNNKEVDNRTDYLNATMSGEFITFLEGDSVFSFPVSDFISGERHQSNREINQHLKDTIESRLKYAKELSDKAVEEYGSPLLRYKLKLEKNIEEENRIFEELPKSFIKGLNEAQERFLKEELDKCSEQCFCDVSCKKPIIKTNATRHKAREDSKFHAVGYLEGINEPKSEEITLEKLKEYTINNNSLCLDLMDILGITLCDNKEYIYKLIERKIFAEKENKTEKNGIFR